jgi:hypothetical protein
LLATGAAACVAPPLDFEGKQCQPEERCPEPLQCVRLARKPLGTCLSGVGATLQATPSDDLLVRNGTTLVVRSELAASFNSRGTEAAYLRFDVTGLAGASGVAAATLRFQATGAAAATGAWLLSRTATAAWTESTFNAASPPAIAATLDRLEGTIASGAQVDFDVTAAISGDGAYGFVLQAEMGESSKLELGSKDLGPAPLLLIRPLLR